MTSTNESQIPSRPLSVRGLIPFAACTSLLFALTASACSSDNTPADSQPTAADAAASSPDTAADACATHVFCGEACVDLENDHEHCGNCESACGADQFCRGAQCRTCEEVGLANCNGHCADL